MVSFADFDRYCEERNVQPGQYGGAFAQWLANISGETIIGGPAGEPPEFVPRPITLSATRSFAARRCGRPRASRGAAGG